MTTAPHMPREVRRIQIVYRGACYWCGGAVPAGASGVYYVDERAVAHQDCHGEASAGNRRGQ